MAHADQARLLPVPSWLVLRFMHLRYRTSESLSTPLNRFFCETLTCTYFFLLRPCLCPETIR
jgi:hypothetical protein